MTPSSELWFLIASLVKVTISLLLTAFAVLCLRRSTAALRHWLWVLGLGLALCLPLLSQTIPVWPLFLSSPSPLPHSQRHNAPRRFAAVSHPRTSNPVPAAASLSVPHSLPTIAAPAPTPQATPALSPIRNWQSWCVLAWAVGAAFGIGRWMMGFVMTRRLLRDSQVVSDGPLADALTEAQDTLHVKRVLKLRLAAASSTVRVPLTFGAFRPVIILPVSAAEWPAECLQAALLHEAAHIRRQDWLVQRLAALACALYWFHPLVWGATRQLRAEGEVASDDLVLLAGMPPADYARHLLHVALTARPRLAAGVIAMAHTPRIENRLRSILAQNPARHSPTRGTLLMVCAAFLFLALPLAALRPVISRFIMPPPLPPVAGANHLQLHEGFTLRYAVTVTDQRSTQAIYQEYMQMHNNYQQILQKDPHFQPVPEEALKPFSYYLSRRPRIRQLVVTVSARDGQLLCRSQENGNTFATIYHASDNGTQLYSNGHFGRIDPGMELGIWGDVPLPGVGLPFVPLFKQVGLLHSSETQQTWNVDMPEDIGQDTTGPPHVLYTSGLAPGLAHVVKADDSWKVLDADCGDEQFQFRKHQQFQGLWIASQVRLTQYTSSRSVTVAPQLGSAEAFREWIYAHQDDNRTPTTTWDYRLLSASTTPLSLAAFGSAHQPIIVIDPGHGGQDTGAIAPDETTEKAINFEVAQKLQAALEQRGATVYLTRQSDTFSTIRSRLQFAEQKHANYLISLHCNEKLQFIGAGTLVYYHDNNSQERRLAQDISRSIGQETTFSPNHAVSDQTRFLAGFGILRMSSMPAVLVECGYLNNPRDLARLHDPQAQQSLANGIADGLVSFQHTHQPQ